MTGMDEKVNFEINGTTLLSRDLNVFTSTQVNHKTIMEQIKQLAIQNNTAGASIFDLATIVKADTMAEVTHALKAIDEKATKMRAEDQQHQEMLQKMQDEAAAKLQEAKQKFEAEQNMLDRQRDFEVAELKGAGYQTGDLNTNQQSDYLDSLEYLDKKRQQDDTLSLKREMEINKNARESEKLTLKQQELQVKKEIADKQLQVAKENKNK